MATRNKKSANASGGRDQTLWVGAALVGLGVSTWALHAVLRAEWATAVQVAGSAVLVVVTVIYVVATQDLVRLERSRREQEAALRRVEAARVSRHHLRNLDRQLLRIAEASRTGNLASTLEALRSPDVGNAIAAARKVVNRTYDTASSIVDDLIRASYGADGAFEAAEYAEMWLDLLDLLRASESSKLEDIWTESEAGRLARFRDSAYDGKPALSDEEGLMSGKWAFTASQGVFNSWVAFSTFIDETSHA